MDKLWSECSLGKQHVIGCVIRVGLGPAAEDRVAALWFGWRCRLGWGRRFWWRGRLGWRRRLEWGCGSGGGEVWIAAQRFGSGGGGG